MLKKVKKVLIFGADGMLGNAVYRYLFSFDFDVAGTSRKKDSAYFYFDAEEFKQSSFEDIVKSIKPDYVINCIGLIRPNVNDFSDVNKALLINSVFPKNLSLACNRLGIRLIHFSTDCVFSGSKGNYDYDDMSDEAGIYGMSKFLGETCAPSSLTIRTSIIGLELSGSRNLLNWFLSVGEGEAGGFSEVLWNGITTLTAAKIIKKIIDENLWFDENLIQLTSETVSKLDLLKMVKEIYGLKTKLVANNSVKSDKTLNGWKMQKYYFSEELKGLYEQIRDLKDFYDK